MKRHIAWLFSCGLLVGCAPSPPPIDEPSDPTPALTDRAAGADDANSPSGGGSAPAAFHFRSGVLEIGDFDPYTLGDDIFDPCTEISPEEFAAAGFHNVEPFPEEYAGLLKGRSTCEFVKHSKFPGEAFSNTDADKDHVREQALLLPYTSELLPDLFVYGSGSELTSHCYAQIDTTRGGLVSEVAGLIDSGSEEASCAAAIENLESLYRVFS